MKKREWGAKQICLVLLFPLVSWFIGDYFEQFADENLIPLKEIMYIFPLIVLMLFIFISFAKDLIIKLNNRKTKNTKGIKKELIGLISTSVILFLCLWPCILAVNDIIDGPKEITLYNVKMVRERIGHKGAAHYYLLGTTSHGVSKKIEFWFGRQSEKEIDELIENNIKLKIYYFESSNAAYYVEETKWIITET